MGLHDLLYRLMNDYGEIYNDAWNSNKFTNSISDIVRHDICEELYRIEKVKGFFM